MAYTAPGIDSAGLHVPEYEDIKQRLLDRFRQIFGEDLYLGEDTQDYQMIAEFADCLDDVYSLIIASFNSRDPSYATGTALDMIIALNGLRRIVATKSTVGLTLSGTAGSVIPAGSAVRDSAGYQWITDAEAVIGPSGSVSVTAACAVAGAINAPAGSITRIMTPTAGWVSVTNEAAASPGQNTESDAQLHERREKSVANTGVAIVEAIYGSVMALTGVIRARLYQNASGTADENGIPGHSICMCVQGAEDDQIARAIFEKKSPGCGTFGNTSAAVTDVFGNVNTIRFTRPAKKDLSISVTIRTFGGYNDSTIDDIKSNIIRYVDSLQIGDNLNVGLLWAPILAVNTDPVNPVCSPVSVTVNGQSDIVSLAFDEYPYSDESMITVTVAT